MCFPAPPCRAGFTGKRKMDVTNDATISRTARKLAGAVEALVRSLAARRPYMPRDGLETESLLLTPWIQINRPDLAQSYCDYLYWISVEARRLYRQRSSELPSENWLTQHLFFTEQCFKFTILLRQLAAHIDGRSGERGSSTPTQPSNPEAEASVQLSVQDWGERHDLSKQGMAALDARLRRKRGREPEGDWFQEVQLPKKNSSGFIYRGGTVLPMIDAIKKRRVGGT